MAPPEGLLTRADDVAGDDQLDAAVLLPSGGGAVRRNGRAFSETLPPDGARGDPLLHEIRAHRFTATLRQPLIGVVGAHVVGVTLDLHAQSLLRCQDAGDARELFARARLQRVAAR